MRGSDAGRSDLLSKSIARNIAVDDNDIDFERLKEAAKTACIHDYVMGLPLEV